MARARAYISKSSPQLKKSIVLLAAATNANYGAAQNVGYGFAFAIFVKATGATGSNSVVIEARDEANNWAVWKTINVSTGDSSVLVEALSSVSVIRARVSPYAGGTFDVRCEVLNVALETSLARALADRIAVTPQILTSEQKAQARENIGATSEAGAGLDPNDAELTGNTSVERITPAIHDLGDIANDGTATLHATIATSRATALGAAMEVAFPAGAPRAVQSLILDSTSATATTVSIPESRSLVRDTLITSYVHPAGASTVLTWVHTDGEYRISGDRMTDAQVKAALNLSIADIPGLADALNALAPKASPALTGVPTVPTAAEGTNTTQAASTAFVLANSEAGVGYAAPVTIAAENVQWTAGYLFKKSLSDDIDLTFSDTVDGKRITVYLTNPSSYTASFDPAIVWTGGSPPVITVAGSGYAKTTKLVFERVGSIIYGEVAAADLFIADEDPPVYVSSVINAAGNRLIDTYNEALNATVTTTTGRNLVTSVGGTITCSSPVVSGSTVEWTLSPLVQAGETVSDSDYTAPGTGIMDAAGNYAESYSNQQGLVTNSSAVSGFTYLLVENFEGANSDSQGIAGYDTPGIVSSSASVNPNYATSPAPLEGTYSLRPGTSSRYIDIPVTGSPRGFYVRAHPVTTAASTVMRLLNGSTTVAIIEMTSGNKIKLTHGTVVGGSMTDSFVVGTTWRLWIYYAPATSGANGVLRAGFSSSDTKPTSGNRFVEMTNGDATLEANWFRVGGLGSNVIFDKVRVSASEIGDNPS